MSAWKLLTLARRAQSTWKRIPPEKRRQVIDTAGREAKKYGPIVAKRIRKVLDDFNKPSK